MFIYVLIFIQIIYTAAQTYNASGLDESVPKSQHIWHSYTFNTGAGNREELHFSNVVLNSNFETVRGIFSWKSLQIQDQLVVFGLGDNFLKITTINKKNDSFTYKQEIQGPAKALTVFQKWDTKTQKMEGFLIVATHSSNETCLLMWYQVQQKRLKFLWDWQYHGKVTQLDIIKINFELKLLIVNQKSSAHKPSAEIYSFHVNHELDVWLFEKIILEAISSSVTVLDNNDNVFFCASYPSLETVHIFKYSKLCSDTLGEKHFVSHQKIFSVGLKSVTSFRVDFRWYLAVAGNSSYIYRIGENLLFQPVSTLSLGNFNNWLAIPVDTYREDTVLLADSGSNISVIAWTGDEDIKTVGSLRSLVCEDDIYCSEKMKKAKLNESTAFSYNGNLSIIISSKNEIPLLFTLHIKLKPLPDKTMLELNEILNMKKFLEKNYTSQNEQINQLLSEKIDSTKINSGQSFEVKQTLKTESQTKNESEILTDVNQLKAMFASLNLDAAKFLADLKSNFSEDDDSNLKALLTKNVTDGITFYGNVLISELNLSTLNDYSVNELLKDSFRKNNAKKIGGKKTLKNLKVQNVIFEKLGDTLACDILFSGDLCESQHNNVVNGDVIWDNKLIILNDVVILHEGTKQNVSGVKVPRGNLKPVYDSLNFEELEITEDFQVQKSINGQPFILPVHGAHSNILEMINQARIEVVNVKEKLNIEFINGKNYSFLAENILRGTPSQLQFDSMKVEGVFSAPIIQADQLNEMDLLKEIPETDAEETDQESMMDDPTDREPEPKFKEIRDQTLKRVIHVFQNLEVDGILFANKLNNISWTVLNDTVKKDEETVTLAGTKTFQKPLRSEKVVLTGTLNGRFVDHIMTNFSDQVIRFPQVFDTVTFKNVSLGGVWDGVNVTQLNESLVRLSADNGENSTLIFEDDCYMNVLKVTNMVNNVSLDDEKAHESRDGKIQLKSIKASRLVLHGSLITNNKINNMNLSNFNMLRVSLKSPETFEKDIYHYNVTVSGDLNVETVNMNDLASIINSGGDTSLIENFMNGNIRSIKKLLVKGNISTSHGINGFDLPGVVERGVRITRPISMKGNITFENIVYFNNLNVTNSIDGFSLKNLEKDIAFKNSHVFLTGPKNFSTLKVTKGMRTRSLNGHLMQEVVTLKGDHTMKGPVVINGDVIVRGNMSSYSAVNDVVVSDLLKSYSTMYNSFIYSGDLNLSSDQVTIRNLVVNGKIQNVSLDALVNDAILKNDSLKGLVFVSGKKSFHGEVKFNENVLVRGLIHGINFSSVFSDITYIHKPTKLGGRITIQESVLKDLETSAHFNATLINNIDTNDWLEDSIPLDRYEIVSGKKTFEQAHVLQDISVDFIRGHLPSAMIPLKTQQYIPAVALFPRLHATSDVSVAGFVNGKNLQSEFEDSVMLHGSQTITGKTVFDNEFIVKGTLSVDSIKGKPVSSLITLDTDQLITTPLQFTGVVKAKQNVENLKFINNISLSDWSNRSVLLDQEQVLDGLWTVTGKIKTKNVKGEGLIRSVSLPNISKEIQKGRLMAFELKNATEKEYFDQCRKVEQLSKQFSELPYLLNQLDIAHEIETSGVIESVITLKLGNADNLIVTFVNNCLSEWYSWNKDTASYDYEKEINIGPVSKWLTVYRNTATYLVTSSLNSVMCEENYRGGNVWLFEEGSGDYAHILTANAFVDITQENSTADEFFTIDKKGILQQWTFQDSKNIILNFESNLGSDKYRFIDFRIMGELSVSNGREIKQIRRTADKVIEHVVPLPVLNAHLVALPIDSEVFTGLVVSDKIVIYENVQEEKMYTILYTYKAGSVLWLSFGPGKQAFLIVASHHKLIEVYEYKSISGFVKKISVHMFSTKLQSVTLPVQKKYQPDKFLIVIQKKKLVFIRFEMFGDFYLNNDSLC